MIHVEVLPAGYGDCLLVSCPVGERVWRLLVDTGPDETWPLLKNRLAALPPDGDGKRHIDLAIVTHIDHDHIGGAQLLFSDSSLGLCFGDVWFNGRPHLDARGVAEGQGLAELLGDAAAALPWNRAFAGAPVVTAGEGAFREVDTHPGAPKITLLSPTPGRLAALGKTWDKELQRLRRRERQPEEPRSAAPRGGFFPDLESLARHVNPTDRAAANGSSIAVLLEHGGASLLLGADAFPTVLAPALAALGRHRGSAGPLQFDAYKVSHHGSRANLTSELLRSALARHYVLSTNNAVFGLPHDDTLARLVQEGGPHPTLWFNYATESNRRWADAGLRQQYGFDVVLPAPGQGGVTLMLPTPP